MKVVWDERKREANLKKHGLDFAELEASGFFTSILLLPAKGNRFLAIGRFKDGTVAVVFATLGIEAISIISVRPASKSERRIFDAQQA